MLVTKRRSVLAGLGGLALTGWLGRHALGQASLRVGVIGGGIVGTSIALNLAAAGARVTLFERTGPAAGATAKSFAWVNAFSDDAHYRMLRLESLAMWRKLDVELGLGMVWGGALLWQSVGEEAETLARDIQALEGSDYPLGGISADEFAAMASEFTPGNIAVAAYSPIDGHLDPVAVTLKLLEAAKFLGVEVKMPCSVEALKLDGDKLQSVQTCSGEVPLDRLVIAAGTDTPALTSGAGASHRHWSTRRAFWRIQRRAAFQPTKWSTASASISNNLPMVELSVPIASARPTAPRTRVFASNNRDFPTG